MIDWQKEDIYFEEGLDEFSEGDEISAEEAGFMKGFIAS
jgi:hypothetical protein